MATPSRRKQSSMADLNVISVTGRLTRDPELRATASGKSVCSFRIAVNGFKDGDTTFLDVSAWGKTGEASAQYLSKGSKVAVAGRLQIREWETQDGEPRTAVEIVANDVSFIETNSNPRPTEATPAAAPAEDTVPF